MYFFTGRYMFVISRLLSGSSVSPYMLTEFVWRKYRGRHSIPPVRYGRGRAAAAGKERGIKVIGMSCSRTGQ